MSLIVTANGDPTPSQEILAGLKALDSQFSMRWIGGIQQWAIMYEWHDSDPRMHKVRTQQIAPTDAADVMTYLPKDATADEAYPIIINSFRRISSNSEAKEFWNDMLNRVHAYNEGLTRSRRQAVIDDVIESIGENIPGRPIIRFNASVAEVAAAEAKSAEAEAVELSFLDESLEPMEQPDLLKKRGRVKGSKNKSKVED